ncbi:MAG: T9SS type A sorting domain-containing protein [candidate division Zixibacteria bacterium]|nr:T9SS type A sorting domain-containing protein [candidate division Zixibacteria bacterium]
MKKLLVLFVALALISSVSYAASNKGAVGSIPVTFDNGGPDDFGYYWEDNDGGGTVPFEWVDITTIGTEVEGLGDDNNVGPIPLGFNFPYYWYDVNRLWIGSNGYISFSSNANFAHPFSNIPYRGMPNDLLCPLTGDLDPSRGDPHVYYWSNNTDSFVVSWHDVGEFGYIDSLHTFQLVLDANDSSITFYYGEQQGNFLDSNGENKNVIGMENVTGNVGLQYLRDNTPSSHMFHEDLALRFWPEPDTSFEAHDVGVWSIFNENNGAKIHAVGYETVLLCLVKNYGTEPETDFDVIVTVKDPDGTTVVEDTVTVTEPIPGGGFQWIDTFESFTPDMAGEYRVDCKTRLSGDEVRSNDAKRAELRAVPFQDGMPVDVRYDDGQADNGRSWNGDFSGFGNEFELPDEYLPMQVHNVQFDVWAATMPGNAHVWVMDDDGTGNPGEILAADTVNVNTAGQMTVDFSSANITITEGKAFAIVIAENQSTFSQSMDESATAPFSYRGWEYTGGLAADRDRETSDVMIWINATVSPTSVDDPKDDEILPAQVSISQNYPNPFNPSTTIDYTLPSASKVNIEVFNLVGQKVKTLVDANVQSGVHSVTWDGTNDNGSKVSSGVYFYRLSADDETIVKRMTLMK